MLSPGQLTPSLICDRFWGVFWLDASSESSLARGFVDIAEKCNLHDKSPKGARLWLQETAHFWLLILDNADDPNIDYAMYLPAASKGHVLITSRVEDCAALQTAGRDLCESLDKETAVELLLKACGIDSSLYDANAVEALEIVDLLGRHALAIHQAGASIKQGICDLKDYKKRFEGQRERLLRIRPRQAGSPYGDVYSTFEVTATYLSNLSERENQTATDALALLNCYAFMSFTAFPEKAFEEAWRNSRKFRRDVQPDTKEEIQDLSPWHRSHLPSFMRQCSSEDLDTLSLREAQSLLASLSIVVLDLPTHTTSMHPVTHMWAKDRLEKRENLTNIWLGALAVLCCSVKDPCVPGMLWEQEALWVQLQPHIESIRKPSSSAYLCNNEFHLRRSFVRLIWVLHELRADKAAIAMLRTWVLGADLSWTGFPYGEEIGDLYGVCLLNCGDFKEATKTLEHVVEMRGRQAEDHDARLTSQDVLAMAYLEDGRVNKAVELFEYTVLLRSEMAEDDPYRLASEEGLAIAYEKIGQTSEAVKLLEHVVEVKQKLVEHHTSRILSQHNLASAYLNNNQISEAVELLEHVVKIQNGKLSEDNSMRLLTQQLLARIYHINGQFDKAIKLLEHVVQIYKRTLVENHPDRLGSQQSLARAYRESGQIDEAIKLLEHVVKIKPANNPSDRIAPLDALARVYRENGQIDRSIAPLEHIVKIKLTENQPSLLDSQNDLALAYIANGKTNEAIELLEHVVWVADNRPDRMAALYALAIAYGKNGQINESMKILHDIFEVDNHPDRFDSLYGEHGRIENDVD